MLRAAGAAALATALLACSSPQVRQVRSVMESTVVPASDALFNAVIYTNGRLASSPQTDADWDRLRGHAARLSTAAVTLRGLAPAGNPDEWLAQADALGAASSATIEAIDRRNLEGVLEAGSRLYDSCTACHATYVTDLP